MISDFFYDDKPCPPEIKDCLKLREEFKKELSLINPKSCKPCVLNSLQNKYLNIISSRDR